MKRILCFNIIVAISLLVCGCRNGANQRNEQVDETLVQAENEGFPTLPQLSDPISVQLAYRSNTSITGFIEGYQERSKNLDAYYINGLDTVLLSKQRVMLVDQKDHGHYAISESPVALYNERGNIIFVPGRSSSCPYDYQSFLQDSLLVDESGLMPDFDFKLCDITQQQWKELLSGMAPVRIKKDYPIAPVLYFEKGDGYKYALLFSVRIRGKVVLCCCFDYNVIPDTELGQYFRSVVKLNAYLYPYTTKMESMIHSIDSQDWIDIFDYRH